MNKNIFCAIEVGSTMLMWMEKYQQKLCFVGDNIKVAHEVARIQKTVSDTID